MKKNIWRHALGCCFALFFLLGPTTMREAHADDVADEAELQFTLATERYRQNDFRGALEHFLASNRLAPNRNVVYNIARAYEQLKQYPDAFRYYTQALDGETDQGTRKRIEEARTRIAPYVGVLNISTEPPGATIYLDRRDLGARGQSPRALGLPPGSYKVIVEMPGYEGAESQTLEVKAGSEQPVKLTLVQILGIVQVRGEPAGAVVRVDREDAEIAGMNPCDVPVPPGRHTFFITRDGFQTQEMSVDVPAKGTTTLRPHLSPQVGAVVVNTDVRDALIEVDGEPKGFSPSVVQVPVGAHRVRVSMGGFRPVEQLIIVRADEQTRMELQLTQMDEVVAASRTAESVEDAPSSVTVITSQEIRGMGYPTIGEALRGVRGLYLSNDTGYLSVGVRGLGVLGSYGNRVLVLLDGHPMNDNYVDSSYIGYDARTDIDDVERIEIVRGPGSVLYGTSAFSGVINIVTRSHGQPTYGEVSAAVADYGVGRGRATANVRFGPNAGMWVSAAGAHATGRDFNFADYANDTPPSVAGNARGIDGFDVGTGTVRLWYKDFTIQFFANKRDKTLPAPQFGTTFGDPRFRYVDSRATSEARYEPQVTKTIQLLSRAYINYYGFNGFYPDNIGVEHDNFDGLWGGIEQRALWTPTNGLRVTLGGEFQHHFNTHIYTLDDTGKSVQDRNDPYNVGAGYLVADWNVTNKIKVSAGGRLDYYSNTDASSLSPRVAIVAKPYNEGNLKVMFGKAFRAPSDYELHYLLLPLQRAADKLSPEDMYSGEIELTHRFSSTVSGTAAVYTNYAHSLIIYAGSGTAADPNYYTNSKADIVSAGGELEVRRDWRQGWMLSAQYSYQHSQYVGENAGLRDVPNSPEHLASAKGAVPILGRTLQAMTRVSFEGQRFDRFTNSGDPPQGRSDWGFVWDAVLSGEAERLGVRYAFGVYNLFDARYTVPVSPDFRMRTMVQPGRTFYAQMTVRF